MARLEGSALWVILQSLVCTELVSIKNGILNLKSRYMYFKYSVSQHDFAMPASDASTLISYCQFVLFFFKMPN